MNQWYQDNKSARGLPERSGGEEKKDAAKGAAMKAGTEKAGS
jgi:hypothetical protein